MNAKDLFDSLCKELNQLLKMDRDTGQPFYVTQWALKSQLKTYNFASLIILKINLYMIL